MDSPCKKQTVCKVLNRFQHGKYLVAYVLKAVSFNCLISLKIGDNCIQNNHLGRYMYRLFNVLWWLWNIYELAVPECIFITNIKHCIFLFSPDQLFPVADNQVSHHEIYMLCNILLHLI